MRCGKKRSQPAAGAAEIGCGKDDSRRNDADADFTGAGDCEHEGASIRPTGRAKLVAGNYRDRIAGQCGRVGSKIFQKCRD